MFSCKVITVRKKPKSNLEVYRKDAFNRNLGSKDNYIKFLENKEHITRQNLIIRVRGAELLEEARLTAQVQK